MASVHFGHRTVRSKQAKRDIHDQQLPPCIQLPGSSLHDFPPDWHYRALIRRKGLGNESIRMILTSPGGQEDPTVRRESG